MSSGKINVAVENIFPLIKKFLYSDHEIFLRELISNATDATLKLKHLTNIGEAKVEYGNPQIEIKVDKENRKLHVIDQGLGMTSDEVNKYINEVAFSGAEEFINQYKGALTAADLPVVFYSPRALEIKQLQAISQQQIMDAFQSDDLMVYNNSAEFKNFLFSQKFNNTSLLLMSSGNYGGLNFDEIKQLF